ncbi:pseudouridine synthase [Halocella sp. SP3-1]|uniref:pseudouridine synthase n=1 Tax=Halocella sp. SP3-1 TaxID=2382161 RepID=UPI000F76274C|nr:pseudouridine synthase [Halocella sp. SP3-1]AZO95602.1 rRNA pseudouridine synthase [Halocella sp. SP3-1]
MERLQKVMAHAGVASRRKSEDIIKQGRVKVNGSVVRELGVKVSTEDTIEVDGQKINREKKVYVLLNKPSGCITTVNDPRGRDTVLDYIQGIKERIYPVGRLDYDTSGLLLLSNDGDLTYKLTHPSHEIDKIYQVEIPGHPSPGFFKQLEKGVKLEDGLTAPASVQDVIKKGNSTIFILTIHEGRNRQVRRMCSQLDYQVIALKRIGFAFLNLDGVSEGSYRFLSNREVNRLKKI